MTTIRPRKPVPYVIWAKGICLTVRVTSVRTTNSYLKRAASSWNWIRRKTFWKRSTSWRSSIATCLRSRPSRSIWAIWISSWSRLSSKRIVPMPRNCWSSSFYRSIRFWPIPLSMRTSDRKIPLPADSYWNWPKRCSWRSRIWPWSMIRNWPVMIMPWLASNAC